MSNPTTIRRRPPLVISKVYSGVHDFGVQAKTEGTGQPVSISIFLKVGRRQHPLPVDITIEAAQWPHHLADQNTLLLEKYIAQESGNADNFGQISRLVDEAQKAVNDVLAKVAPEAANQAGGFLETEA